MCPGHPDKHFVKMVATKGGNILSPSGNMLAYLDTQQKYLSSMVKCIVKYYQASVTVL